MGRTIIRTGDDSAELFRGTSYSDDLVIVYANGGNDTYQKFSSYDSRIGSAFEVHGGAGNDVLSGSGNGGFLFGDSGNDQLALYVPADKIGYAFGGAGNDVLSDGAVGTYVLDGGAGTDRLLDSNAGRDRYDGGSGYDYILVYNKSTYVGVHVDLSLGRLNMNEVLEDTYHNIEGVNGTESKDLLEGNEVSNALIGGEGNDTLEGKGGDDILLGDNQPKFWEKYLRLSEYAGWRGSLFEQASDDELEIDTLRGGLGNDLIMGGYGRDTVDGGSGSDTAIYADSLVSVVVNLATRTATGGSSNGDTLTSIENLVGSVRDKYDYEHTTGNDILTGNSLANRLEGLSGDDSLAGGDGQDELLGGDGHDRLNGGFGNDAMYGGKGDDVYTINTLSDAITEYSNAGSDTVIASFTYKLKTYFENLSLAGETAIHGIGNGHANKLTGNKAVNTLQGEGGNDTLNGGQGADKLEGGSGIDTASYSDAAPRADAVTGVTVDLLNPDRNTGEAFGDTFVSIENLMGSGFKDTLSGSGLANVLRGEAGDDVLSGHAGADRLYGGAGNDTLDGGLGRDTFVFQDGFGNSRIVGFQDSANETSYDGLDVIDLTFLQDWAWDTQVGMSDLVIKQVGADTVIWIDLDRDGQADSARSISLTGVDETQIGASDFLF